MLLAGRLLMGAGFAAFGLWNIGNHPALTELMRARRIPVPGIAAAIGIATQLCGGVLLAAGLWTTFAVLALIAFVVAATLVAHVPIGSDPEQRRGNIIACLMNVIVVGGLLAYAW